MDYSDLFLYFSVGTLGILVIILLSLIRRVDKQFKELKGLQLDDIHLENKINEEVERLQVEQNNIQQDLLRRVKELESRIEEIDVSEQLLDIEDRLDELSDEDEVKIESVKSAHTFAHTRNNESNEFKIGEGITKGAQLDNLSARVMKVMQSNDSVVTDDLADTLNISDDELKQVLEQLEDEGSVERIGESGELLEYRIKE